MVLAQPAAARNARAVAVARSVRGKLLQRGSMDRPQIFLVNFYQEVIIIHKPSLKQCFFNMRSKIHTMFHLKRFLRNSNDGATIVEFALLMPIFLLLLVGLLDFGLLMTKWVLSENAINKVSRSRMIDSNRTNNSKTIQQEISEDTLGLIKLDDANSETCVRVREFASLADLNTAPALENCQADCSACTEDGGAGDSYVLYQIIFTHNFVTPLFNKVTFTTSSVLRNEAGAAPPPGS